MFANLKIGKRLALAFAVMVVLLVAVAGIGVLRLTAIGTETDLMLKDRYVKVQLASKVQDNINDAIIALKDAALTTDPEQLKGHLARLNGTTQATTETLARLEKMLVTQKGKELFEALANARKGYRDVRDPVLKLIGDGKRDQARDLMFTAMVPALKHYTEAAQAIIDYQEKLMDEAGAETSQLVRSTTLMMAALAAAAIFFACLLGFWVTRSITRPIGEAVDAAKRVAAGDLTSSIVVKTKDETGELLQALKDMNESLVRIVGEVRDGTDTISTASKEIAAGNQDLSQRTEEQASSLEETASSMEELTGTVKQNADNARQANQLAAKASEVAIKGGSVVGEVVTTMGSINDSSKKIADIIGVIDGIAFQTNILALNAAVEAARAGEQGRGFAVVAGEVRNLAQRSSAAAKEIKALIEDSVAKVGNGTRLVDEAGKTMDEVVSSIKRVTDIMGEITAASHEQSTGIEQVNQAVAQMDQVTQQNAALVEEAAAAAESMQEQAQHLTQAVSVFKLDGRHAQVSAKPAQATPQFERRSPNRAKNVTRLPAASAKPVATPPKTGTDDEWTEF